MTSDDGAFVDA